VKRWNGSHLSTLLLLLTLTLLLWSQHHDQVAHAANSYSYHVVEMPSDKESLEKILLLEGSRGMKFAGQVKLADGPQSPTILLFRTE
jgi:hypothetical protein